MTLNNMVIVILFQQNVSRLTNGLNCSGHIVMAYPKSGVERPVAVTKIGGVMLAVFDAEYKTNYSALESWADTQMVIALADPVAGG